VGKRGFASRRVIFLLSVTTALVLAVSVGAGTANATTVGCFNASKTVDGTTLSAHWCWNASLNLTDLAWHISSAESWQGMGYDQTEQGTKTGGIGYHTASDNFAVDWNSSGCGYISMYQVAFWAHVVGGSTTLDFVATGNGGYCFTG
jgi:hypothetical protein